MLREIMRQLLFIPILSKKDEREFKETLSTCCEYVIAFRMELQRKVIQNSDTKNAVELAAYFTRCKLQNTHIMLGLNSAMDVSFKLKNFTLLHNLPIVYSSWVPQKRFKNKHNMLLVKGKRTQLMKLLWIMMTEIHSLFVILHSLQFMLEVTRLLAHTVVLPICQGMMVKHVQFVKWER